VSKTSGLGDQFLFGGYQIGGDIQALTAQCPLGLLDVTDITQSAHSRLGGLRDGAMSLTAYMDPATAAAHAAFSPLTTSDIIATYLRGQAIGNPALCQQSRQLNYDPTRAADGSVTEKIDCQADEYGQEWGLQLTPGVRTDTTATNGTGLNNGAATSYGCQAYLHVTGFTGTSVDIQLQQSTTGSSGWTSLIDFGSQSGIGASRMSVSNSTTVDQYLRAVTGTGTFSSVSFALIVVRNLTAGQVF
jgi:hypothetical protein